LNWRFAVTHAYKGREEKRGKNGETGEKGKEKEIGKNVWS